jgi:hypothetical protein
MTTISDAQARQIAEEHSGGELGLIYFRDSGEISERLIERVGRMRTQLAGGLQTARDGNMDMDLDAHAQEVADLASLEQYMAEAGVRPEQEGWDQLSHDTGHSL